jgi:tetrapyrrole methylase family protein/MazG family protein
LSAGLAYDQSVRNKSVSFFTKNLSITSGIRMGTRRSRAVPRSTEKDETAPKRTLADLLNIMATLRGPSGCPWDKQQTAHTLKRYLIEEAYETLEAIETGTPEALKEELGDLLLQIIFLSRIFEEEGEFRFSDVVHTLAEKLIRRHPHVFPSAHGTTPLPKTALDVASIWRTIKELEGKYTNRTSLLEDIPLALPALERAQRISQRVSHAGWDGPAINTLWEKIQEELAQLRRATRNSSQKAGEEELGDLLFTLVNWARLRNISAEEALRKATRRFSERFRRVEMELRQRGKTREESPREQMDHAWNPAKNVVKKKGRKRQ